MYKNLHPFTDPHGMTTTSVLLKPYLLAETAFVVSTGLSLLKTTASFLRDTTDLLQDQTNPAEPLVSVQEILTPTLSTGRGVTICAGPLTRKPMPCSEPRGKIFKAQLSTSQATPAQDAPS